MYYENKTKVSRYNLTRLADLRGWLNLALCSQVVLKHSGSDGSFPYKGGMQVCILP